MTLSHFGKLGLFLLLNLLDLLLTRWLVEPGSSEFREVNPVANWWLNAWGWSGLVLFKFATSALAGGLFVIIARCQPRMGERVLNVSCLAVGMVVLYSGILLGSNHDALAEIRQGQEQDRSLERERVECREFQVLLARLRGDLQTGRTSLAEATATLMRDHAGAALCRSRLLAVYPNGTEEERTAALLLTPFLNDLSTDSSRGRRTAKRLQAEFRATFGKPVLQPVWVHPSARASSFTRSAPTPPPGNPGR